jgi:small-conductance mechanosensitive channel
VAALGEYGVTLKILGTVRAPDQWAAAGEVRKRLLAAFREHGIEIPRPQRVILSRDPGAFPPPDESMAEAGIGEGPAGGE